MTRISIAVGDRSKEIDLEAFLTDFRLLMEHFDNNAHDPAIRLEAQVEAEIDKVKNDEFSFYNVSKMMGLK